MKKAVLSSSQDGSTWPDNRMYALAVQDFRRMQAIMPSSTLLLAAPVGNWMGLIDSGEREIVQHAVRRRQEEFSTGRMLAAQALNELGAVAAPVLQGPLHEPLWPPGIVGSITHSSGICLLAATADNNTTALGIDVETDRTEFGNVAHLILRQEESEKAARPGLPAMPSLRQVFCAKESVYKAISTRANRFVDFQEVLINFCPDTCRFTATAPEDSQLNTLLCAGEGRYVVAEKFLFAVWFHQQHG